MIEVMLPFKVGDRISYIHITRARINESFPAKTIYLETKVTGVVKAIRDIFEDKLSANTVYNNPDIERSRYLITVRTENRIRKDYLGSMVNVKRIKDMV